jgi:YHS domain-containing protein
MTNYKLRYLVMPDYLFERNDLTALQLKIASFVYTFKGSRFYFSNEHLAEMLIAEPQSVSRSIRGLVKKKVVSVDYEIKAGGGKLRFITQLLQIPHPGLNQDDESDSTKMMSRIYNGINDNKLNDNPIVPLRGRENSQLLNELITSINSFAGTRYKATPGLLPNFTYWLESYTVEEMAKAYYNSKFHPWWKDKITPTKLLRRKNQNGESADYIGDLLNIKHPEAAR